MKSKLDAQYILQKLAEMRKSVPEIERAASRARDREGRSLLEGVPARTEEDFEYAAVIDGIQSFIDDVEAAVEGMRSRALERALAIYYATEESARDPEHAHLIPYVEEMRAAYQRQFGRPIPPRASSGQPSADNASPLPRDDDASNGDQ